MKEYDVEVLKINNTKLMAFLVYHGVEYENMYLDITGEVYAVFKKNKELVDLLLLWRRGSEFELFLKKYKMIVYKVKTVASQGDKQKT